MPTVSIGRAIAHERLRLIILSALMLSGLLFLGGTLRRVQVVDSGAYREALDQHSIRRVRLPATRGRILDRGGLAFADNRPAYCVALFVEELRQRGAWSNTINAVDALVDDIATVLGRPREIDRAEIATHIRLRRPLPLLAWKGLDDRELARLAESPLPIRGVDIYVQPERIYPMGDCAAHVVGYVGKGQPRGASTGDDGRPGDADAADTEDQEDFDFYLPDMTGRQGIEERYDSLLAGRAGGRLLRVDAVGYKHAAYDERAPVGGQDVVLTIDSRLQRISESALRGRRGAIVLIKVQTGELVVLASAPRFNPADFSPTLAPAVWRELRSDSAHPLLNRATMGVYPPGSILKPVIALAGMDHGIVDAQSAIACPGFYELPNGSKLRCWNRLGHGDIRVQRAVAVSCNPYFCAVGVQLGYEPVIRGELERLGLGRRPDVEIAASAALLPSDAWKRRQWGDGWRVGDTANLSVGQGFISATPLQMAVMAAAFANGGAVLRPRLVLEPADLRPAVINRMSWKVASQQAVRRGMYDAINSPSGTGHDAHLEGVALAGKTGTAEYYVRGQRRKHAWMVAYGPFEEPRYAIAVILEDAESGGHEAGPIVKSVMAEVFGVSQTPRTEVVPHE